MVVLLTWKGKCSCRRAKLAHVGSHLPILSHKPLNFGGCSEEIVQALVTNGTIPTHRAFLGMFGPVCLDGSYVDLVAPDARALGKCFDERMGGPGWQERKKQEREQTKQEIERIKARTEEIHKEGERQQQAFQQQLSEMMERHAQRLYEQISENTERSIQAMKKNEQ